MQVKAQAGNYRIVDDAPLSLRMDGIGLYAIEEHKGTEEIGWWERVYPRYFKCTNDYEEVLREFKKLIS